MFLDSIRERQEEEERQRKLKDGDEVMDFKKYFARPHILSKGNLISFFFGLYRAVAARENATNNPPPPTLSTSTPTPKPAGVSVEKVKSIPAKKDIKKSLKGVLVKKKLKTAPATLITTEKSMQAKEKRSAEGELKPEGDSRPETKRRKTDSVP